MERLSGHAELQELLGAYALDAVEPEEAAVIELHLPTCPRCRIELTEHREAAALLGYAGGAAPKGLWDRIIAELEEPPPPFDLDLPRPQYHSSTPAWMPTSAGSTLASAWRALGSHTAENAAEALENAARRPPRATLWSSTPSSPSPSPSASPSLGRQAELAWDRDADESPGEDAMVVPIDASTFSTPPSGTEGLSSEGRSTHGSGFAGWLSGPAGIGRIHSEGRRRSSRGDQSGRSGKTVPMRWMVAIATTAAVLVAALGIEVGRLENSNKSQQPNLALIAYEVAAANPGARRVTLKSSNGNVTVQAVIVPNGETYLGKNSLQVLPSNETYQMWGIVDGSPVSLGVIGNNPTYAAFSTPTVATALAMTVEASGGVPTTSKTPVVQGDLPA